MDMHAKEAQSVSSTRRLLLLVVPLQCCHAPPQAHIFGHKLVHSGFQLLLLSAIV